MEPEVDPVSGNPIPPGGTAEGVRDDVPALIDGKEPAALSEGEFVIPKNVVDFYGLEVFEQLIENANEQLGVAEEAGPQEEMEDEEVTEEDMMLMEEEAANVLGYFLGGRVERLSKVKAYATGGLVTGDPEPFDATRWAVLGGSLFDTPDGNLGGVEMRTYVNAQGKTMQIMFIDGKPQDDIPDGFRPINDNPVESISSEEKEKNVTDEERDEIRKANPYAAFGGINPYDKDPDELLEDAKEIARRGGIAGKIGKAAMGVSPMIGALGSTFMTGNSISNLRAAAIVAESKGDKTIAEEINAMADKMAGDGFMEDIYDVTSTGRKRAEKWGSTLAPRTLDPVGATESPSTASTPTSRPQSDGFREEATSASPRASQEPTGGTSTAQSSSDIVARDTQTTGGTRPQFGDSVPTARGETPAESSSDIVSSNQMSGGLSFGNTEEEEEERTAPPGDDRPSFNKGGLVKKRATRKKPAPQKGK